MIRIRVDLFLNILRSIFMLIIIFSIFANSALLPGQLTESKDRIIAEEKSDGIPAPGLKEFSTDSHNRTDESADFKKPKKDSLLQNYPPFFCRKLYIFSIWSRSTFT